MWLVGLWLACPWIAPADHAANMGGGETRTAPGGAGGGGGGPVGVGDDDDDDDDGTATQGSCADDGMEPNDTESDAFPLGFPSEIDGVLCPSSPADWYAFEVPEAGWLSVRLTSARCEDLLLRLDGPDGSDITGSSDCPTQGELASRGPYSVKVTAPGLDAGLVRYGLDLSLQPCDADRDGFDTVLCGGADCDDDDPLVSPAAVDLPGDGIDQDCDGGDDLPLTCAAAEGIGLGTVFGILFCGDPQTASVWDRWEVSAPSGRALTVRVRNDTGAADPLALVVAPDGVTHYGLQPDGSQLDDEGVCPVTPWSGGGCPEACTDLGAGGVVSVWVAQWDGAGCVEGASYFLDVLDGEEELLPVQIGDDVQLGWP